VHRGGRNHEVARKFGPGFRKINHDFTAAVLVSMALGSGL